MQMLLVVLVGLPMTILVTVLSFAVGLVGGVPLMLGLRSKRRSVWLLSRLVVDVIRGVPTIVWLFLLYFGFAIGAFRFNPLTAAVLGLGIISSAYLAEMYRGGFATLSRGQGEAAAALGLGRRTTFLQVLAPQALRVALPSLTTYLLALVKDSSIASTIGVVEMVAAATAYARANTATAGLTPFFVAAGVYVAISVPLAIVARRLDTRLAGSR